MILENNAETHQPKHKHRPVIKVPVKDQAFTVSLNRVCCAGALELNPVFSPLWPRKEWAAFSLCCLRVGKTSIPPLLSVPSLGPFESLRHPGHNCWWIKYALVWGTSDPKFWLLSLYCWNPRYCHLVVETNVLKIDFAPLSLNTLYCFRSLVM